MLLLVAVLNHIQHIDLLAFPCLLRRHFHAIKESWAWSAIGVSIGNKSKPRAERDLNELGTNVQRERDGWSFSPTSYPGKMRDPGNEAPYDKRTWWRIRRLCNDCRCTGISTYSFRDSSVTCVTVASFPRLRVRVTTLPCQIVSAVTPCGASKPRSERETTTDSWFPSAFPLPLLLLL